MRKKSIGKPFPSGTLCKFRNAVIGLFAMALMASCHKGRIQPEPGSAKQEDLKVQQMSKYLSVILYVPQNEIIYDLAKDEFSIANTTFRIQRKVVETRYDEANEYKLNYEIKK